MAITSKQRSRLSRDERERAGGLSLAFIMFPMVVRSAHEIFRLVPAGQMEAALAHTPDPAAIPEANIARLRALGLADLAERLARIKGS